MKATLFSTIFLIFSLIILITCVVWVVFAITVTVSFITFFHKIWISTLSRGNKVHRNNNVKAHQVYYPGDSGVKATLLNKVFDHLKNTFLLLNDFTLFRWFLCLFFLPFRLLLTSIYILFSIIYYVLYNLINLITFFSNIMSIKKDILECLYIDLKLKAFICFVLVLEFICCIIIVYVLIFFRLFLILVCFLYSIFMLLYSINIYNPFCIRGFNQYHYFKYIKQFAIILFFITFIYYTLYPFSFFITYNLKKIFFVLFLLFVSWSNYRKKKEDRIKIESLDTFILYVHEMMIFYLYTLYTSISEYMEDIDYMRLDTNSLFHAHRIDFSLKNFFSKFSKDKSKSKDKYEYESKDKDKYESKDKYKYESKNKYEYEYEYESKDKYEQPKSEIKKKDTNNIYDISKRHYVKFVPKKLITGIIKNQNDTYEYQLPIKHLKIVSDKIPSKVTTFKGQNMESLLKDLKSDISKNGISSDSISLSKDGTCNSRIESLSHFGRIDKNFFFKGWNSAQKSQNFHINLNDVQQECATAQYCDQGFHFVFDLDNNIIKKITIRDFLVNYDKSVIIGKFDDPSLFKKAITKDAQGMDTHPFVCIKSTFLETVTNKIVVRFSTFTFSSDPVVPYYGNVSSKFFEVKMHPSQVAHYLKKPFSKIYSNRSIDEQTVFNLNKKNTYSIEEFECHDSYNRLCGVKKYCYWWYKTKNIPIITEDPFTGSKYLLLVFGDNKHIFDKDPSLVTKFLSCSYNIIHDRMYFLDVIIKNHMHSLLMDVYKEKEDTFFDENKSINDELDIEIFKNEESLRNLFS